MIALLIPSRGRPERAERMILSALETASDTIEVRLLVDPDDPRLAEYQALIFAPLVLRVLPAPMGYTAALNHAAREAWDEFAVLGAFGDDVVFRTSGWDRRVEEALQHPGIAYGDDLIHGRNHPSAVFMSSAIAKALGWLALPATTHQWADDGWKRLGQATGTLRFVEEVIVEHEHPAVGKAEWDETYTAVFDSDRAKSDYEGFTAWVETGGLDRDAAIVRQVVEAAA